MTGTPLFHNLSRVKILPKAAVHEKKATLGGILECHTGFQGKRVSGREEGQLVFTNLKTLILCRLPTNFVMHLTNKRHRMN